jgi:hypothetical protein
MAADFSTFVHFEEKALSANLEMARAAAEHGGGEGFLQESVRRLLRAHLPAEYGVSTGFVAHHGAGGVNLSPPLDVILYDAVRSGPLVKLDAFDVFPLEAVYGYVAVKATLGSIEPCLETHRLLCRMLDRRFHVPAAPPGGPRLGRLPPESVVPLRGFVVAFGADGPTARDGAAFARHLEESGASLDGLLIAGHGYFRTRPVEFVERDSPALFKSELLAALGRFPRYPPDWTPALDAYFAA